MTSFSSITDPSLHGMLLDTIEDFDMVATFGGTAVLYPARYSDRTDLPENLHAAVAATALRLRSLDYAKSRYVQSRPRPSRKSSHDHYMDAYRATKSHMSECAAAFESNAEIDVRLGTIAASVALQRLVTSVLGAHLLYRIGLNFEGDAVARHVLEQIAWAVAAAGLDDEDQLGRLSPTRSISNLKSLAPYAGPLYGRLSETTHASLTQHRAVVRSEGETLSVLLTWGRPTWSALTLLQLADLWVLAQEWTQREHMKQFLALDPSAGYEPVVDRPFLARMRSLVRRIEAEEASERDPGSAPDPAPGDQTPSASFGSEEAGADRDSWIKRLEERNPPPGTAPSRAHVLDQFLRWRRVSIRDRIYFANVSDRTMDAIQSLSPSADLRDVDVPGLDRNESLRNTLISALTFAPGHVFLEPWLSGIALGPLAELPVYSSDAWSRWVGKAHAPGLCQHRRQIGDGDDLLTMTDWVSLYREREVSSPFGDWLCSKCGGFAVGLLDDAQAEHFQRATQLLDAFNRIEFYERSEMSDQEQWREVAERAIDVSSAIAAACPDLAIACVTLARRAARLAGDLGGDQL